MAADAEATEGFFGGTPPSGRGLRCPAHARAVVGQPRRRLGRVVVALGWFGGGAALRLAPCGSCVARTLLMLLRRCLHSCHT